MNNPFDEKNEITSQINVLTKVDEFEEKIKLLDKLNKEYAELKSELKEEMLKLGKQINSDQVKWTTPNGIKITCSIGKKAEFETKTIEKFSEVKLAKEYPDIYKKCFITAEVSECVKNASNDRLTITLPKEG